MNFKKIIALRRSKRLAAKRNRAPEDPDSNKSRRTQTQCKPRTKLPDTPPPLEPNDPTPPADYSDFKEVKPPYKLTLSNSDYPASLPVDDFSFHNQPTPPLNQSQDATLPLEDDEAKESHESGSPEAQLIRSNSSKIVLSNDPQYIRSLASNNSRKAEALGLRFHQVAARKNPQRSHEPKDT